MTAPTSDVVLAVLTRDRWTCVRCGRRVQGHRGWDWSIHHRQPRGMGGSRADHLNGPPALIVLCGSGTTGCHGAVESRRAAAERDGYLVRRPALPADVPVLVMSRPDVGRLCWLTSDGRYADHAPTSSEWLCMRCTSGWRPGDAVDLARHLRLRHRVGRDPRTVEVDTSGEPLDTTADTSTADGLIREVEP